MNTVFGNALEFARSLCADDAGGHGFGHVERVCRTAVDIAEKEGADVFVCALAAALHDVDDRKLSPETCKNKDNARRFMNQNAVPEETAEQVLRIIDEVSFKGTDSVTPNTLEGKVVQDADRLDAMGAVGIARCFAYGGSTGRKIYEPGEKPLLCADAEAYYTGKTCSINHFYEKLLLLKDMMNTSSAKREAEKRHAYMLGFLSEFFRETDGKNFLRNCGK